MKTKLILSTDNKNIDLWTDLFFIPRLKEWINVKDLLKDDELRELKSASKNWSGIRGCVESIEYRHDDNDFFAEIHVLCED